MFQERQLIRERATESLESRKFPDSYFFKIYGNKLLSDITSQPVEQYMSRRPGVDQLEFDAFLDIQQWATSRESGLVFWVSPPHRKRSIQGKVIISSLEEFQGEKALLNRAVLFDVAPGESINIANKIQKAFIGTGVAYLDEDEVRRNPIFVPGYFTVEEWLTILEEIIAEQAQWDMIESGEDFEEVKRTIAWAQSYNEGTTGRGNYIGDNPLSCPPVPELMKGSASDIMSLHALKGKFVRNCGKCRKRIMKVIAKGYMCSCKGIYQGC